jgi:hypothetical protein
LNRKTSSCNSSVGRDHRKKFKEKKKRNRRIREYEEKPAAKTVQNSIRSKSKTLGFRIQHQIKEQAVKKIPIEMVRVQESRGGRKTEVFHRLLSFSSHQQVKHSNSSVFSLKFISEVESKRNGVDLRSLLIFL